MSFNDIWHSKNESEWNALLKKYWQLIKVDNIQIEFELNRLTPEYIASLGKEEWYEFLLEKYFRWKYTAPNRFATTTASIKKYVQDGKLDELHDIKNQILSMDLNDISNSLKVTANIRCLGVAGASGLLSLIYPSYFGTVDQFVVKALLEVNDKKKMVSEMKPEGLTVKDGVILTEIMKEKASENNKLFDSAFWNPRTLEMAFMGI